MNRPTGFVVRRAVTTDARGGFSDPYEPEKEKSRMLAGSVAGTVTVRPGEKFSVANRYGNQPGYTWKVTRGPDDEVAWLETEQPHITGKRAAERRR